MTNTTNNGDREAARRKLDDLATWTPDELDEEFSEWPHEKVTNLWTLLEGPYRLMCRAFGIASDRQRMSARGQHTHKQIKRLAVLQKHAQAGVN